jgi:hypothetical protein
MLNIKLHYSGGKFCPLGEIHLIAVTNRTKPLYGTSFPANYDHLVQPALPGTSLISQGLFSPLFILSP